MMRAADFKTARQRKPVNTPERGNVILISVNSPGVVSTYPAGLRYLFSHSSVRCHASLAAASS
jgi:hypothetical protein